MTVVGNDAFGEALARHLGVQFVQLERRIFPDGEVCPRITSTVSGHVVLAHRMSLPADPNAYLMETLLAVKTLKSLGATAIDVVMPYFVYGRQDKAFRSGEPLSAKYVLELLSDAGTSRLFTVSSHADREQERVSIARVPVYNIDGFVALANELKGISLDCPLIIGPDDGAASFVRTVSSVLGCESALFEKQRSAETGDIIMRGDVAVDGRNVVLVDDIVGSGGTMLKAIGLCSEAARVWCAVVHLVSDKGLHAIRKQTTGFFTCNTISSPVATVGVERLVAERIKKEGIKA